MGTVLKFEKYRSDRRKAYYKKFSSHLDRVIRSVITAYGLDDIAQLSRLYQNYCSSQNEMAWDFEEFREILYGIIFEKISNIIIQEAAEHYWFDPVFVTREYVAERSLSMIVLGQEALLAEK